MNQQRKAMSTAPIQIIFGGASLGNSAPFDSEEYMERMYSVLLNHKVTGIDTSQLYGKSETILGATKAGERFTLDTKWMGGAQPGWATRENIVRSAKDSIRELGVKSVDIFYIHLPDTQTAISETLAGVQEVYQLGLFQRFGLSNYQAEDVEMIYKYCKDRGYVTPSVYQGIYSAIARNAETALFPTLRKLGIAYYAYSPLAGGFLTKSSQQITEGAGRFNDATYGGAYKQLFVKPAYLHTLETWRTIAEDEGCSPAELAYRWIVHHSPLKQEQGAGVLIGASSLRQLEQTLVGIEKGKLSDNAAKAIDLIWAKVKHEAP